MTLKLEDLQKGDSIFMNDEIYMFVRLKEEGARPVVVYLERDADLHENPPLRSFSRATIERIGTLSQSNANRLKAERTR